MSKERIVRYVLYLSCFFRHMTVRKLINLLRVEYRLLRNDPCLETLSPYTLYVELSNQCNLACPLCQKGLRRTVPRKNLMSFDTYKKLVEPLKQYLFQISLFDWGEPFLSPDIYDIISYNTRNNIGTIVSSNLNIPVDAERLVDSGLDSLIISGDGVSQEVYSVYRKGGDISKVFANVDSIVAVKKQKRSRYPKLIWQCLVMRHNEQFLEEIRTSALARGVDAVMFSSVNFYAMDCGAGEDLETVQKQWLPRNPKYRLFDAERRPKKEELTIRKPCPWLWRSAVVNVNGGITPCCVYDTTDWGSAVDDSFLAVWKNDLYQEARERSNNDPSCRKHHIICDQCTVPSVYKTKPRLENIE